MYLLGERSEQTELLCERIKKISNHLLTDLPEPEERLELNEVQDLYSQFPSDSLYFIDSGALQGMYENRAIVLFEPGNLVGLPNIYDLPSLIFTSEEPVRLLRYDASTLLRFFNETRERQSIWTGYLITLISIYSNAYSRMVRVQSRPSTGFLQFAAGDIIVQEGDDAHEVFTIIQGKADVYLEGVKVGEVQRDEIFGATAVFTNSKRTATVIATEDSSVLAVPKDEFVTLMQTHPQTTMALIESMARSVASLNAQLVDQEKDLL